MRAAICARVNMHEEMTMHQKREALSVLTMKSDPIPESRRPLKEPKEMVETWISWR